MKTIHKLLRAGLVLAVFTISLARTHDNHVKLTEYHSKIQDLVHKSIEGEGITQKAHSRNADEAGRLLESAELTHSELKNSMIIKHPSIDQLHQSIERSYGVARKHNVLMKLEASKSSFDESRFLEHARDMHKSISQIEKEHQDLVSHLNKLSTLTSY